MGSSVLIAAKACVFISGCAASGFFVMSALYTTQQFRSVCCSHNAGTHAQLRQNDPPNKKAQEKRKKKEEEEKKNDK